MDYNGIKNNKSKDIYLKQITLSKEEILFCSASIYNVLYLEEAQECRSIKFKKTTNEKEKSIDISSFEPGEVQTLILNLLSHKNVPSEVLNYVLKAIKTDNFLSQYIELLKPVWSEKILRQDALNNISKMTCQFIKNRVEKYTLNNSINLDKPLDDFEKNIIKTRKQIIADSVEIAEWEIEKSLEDILLVKDKNFKVLELAKPISRKLVKRILDDEYEITGFIFEEPYQHHGVYKSLVEEDSLLEKIQKDFSDKIIKENNERKVLQFETINILRKILLEV